MVFLATFRLMPLANMLTSSLAMLIFYKDGIIKLYNDVEKYGEKNTHEIFLKNSKKTKYNNNNFKSIEMKNLHFFYPNTNSPALKNINMIVNSGESIGIIGTSGSGKTTLVNILLGLLEPEKGSVLYNGLELKDTIQVWQSKTAYLLKKHFL